jgi:glycosyltransferase involved in cell wall biosynthesis
LPESPSVSVIVPARDAAATLPATLAALEGQRPVDGGHEVIVVDNGSRDETPQLVAAAGAALIRRERGEGPGAARNAGAAAARGRVLAFTDADCAPAADWLSAGLAALDAGLDLVQGRVAASPGAPIDFFSRTLWVTKATGLFETANLFVTKEAFERAGGFGAGGEAVSRTGRHGAPFGEDAVFGWRVARSGGRTGFAEEAIVHHAVFPRGPRGFVAEFERIGLFCGLVAQVPELRRMFLYRRWFLSRRSAAFDAAIAGIALAAITGSALPVAVALPWAGLVRDDKRELGDEIARVLAAADLVSFSSLVRHSIRERSLIL